MTSVETAVQTRSPSLIAGLAAPSATLAALALWTMARKSAWTDEAFSLITAAHRPLSETVQRAMNFELQPPLYFALLNLWLRVSARIEFGRLLSLACALGALVVLWMTARRLELRRPWRLVWLAAVTPGFVWAATEMRAYGLVLLLVATANLLFVSLIYTDPPDPRRTAIAYGITALACVATFYYSGFVLFGHWIGSLVARRRRALVTGALAAAGLAFAPFIPMVLAQVAAQPNPLNKAGAPPLPLARGIYQAIGVWLKTIFGEGPALDAPHTRPIVVAIMLALPVAWLLAQRRDEHSAIGSSPVAGPSVEAGHLIVVSLGVAIAVPIVVVGALRATATTLVYPRHMLMALPGFLLWLAVVADQIPWPVANKSLWAALVASFVVCLGVYEFDHWQVADWRGAAAYIAARSGPDDPVFVVPAAEALPFQYYYRWPAKVIAIPRSAAYDKASDATTVIADTSELASRFDPVVAHDPFWVVRSRRPGLGNWAPELLEQFVATRYRVVSDTVVLNISMRRLVPR